MILTLASGINVFAGTGAGDEKKEAADHEKQIEKRDFSSVLKTGNDFRDFRVTKKDTLAEYEKTKAQGKKFSTTTKVLIGAGIAAAVIGIVIIAASKGAKDAASF